jgi:Type I restriction enzyme R protein N terminus (HSDR_N)
MDRDQVDKALENLKEIAKQFKLFLADRGRASESDTRAKVITKVLEDVLFWPERETDRELNTDSGRMDYRLKVNTKPLVVVEAKAEGIAFVLPVSGSAQRMYKLDGALVTSNEIKEAIEQVRAYCDDEAIRYAIATNGDTWIVFRAIRDDNIGWRKGKARVFRSIDEIILNFTDFWNLLSYEAICQGSLNEIFSSSVRTSRQLHRVVANHFNPDVPLLRNRLNTDIQPLIRLVFEDIADQEELEVLQSCYIHTGTLATAANDLDVIITETIPKFLVDEGAVAVGDDHERGGFLRKIKDSVNISRGDLFLLLGAIGSGKSTFLKRYRRSVGQPHLDDNALWFVVDFLKPPEPEQMQHFVWVTLLKTFRGKYARHECERRKHLKEVFHQEISALESTKLNGLHRGSQRYEGILSETLDEWMTDLASYLPKLVRASCVRLGLKPVVFIDNVDQLSPAYQRDIFLFAQHLTGELSSVTVVALREESYYSANIAKTFTAYNSRKSHIAPPLVQKLLNSRIDYAVKRLDATHEPDAATPSERHKRDQIRNFLKIVQGAIAENPKIASFIKTICHGNMRFALEMFCTFLTSGVTDVEKMLRIYDRDGWYNVAYHEFVKAIILGDRAIYKEDQSPICNLLNVGPEPNSSHFTACRVIAALMKHRGETTREGRGYVEIAKIVVEFEGLFDNTEDVIAAMNRLVIKRLAEPNTRSTDSIEGASHIRVTSAGWFFYRYLIETFAYLDLILQDTPLNDPHVEKLLRESCYQVNNLPDFEDKKVERTEARFLRVERFIAYLEGEEARERIQFELDRYNSPIAEPIMSRIRAEFEDERNWIRKRVNENREKYREEHAYRSYEGEEEYFYREEEIRLTPKAGNETP